MVRIFIDRKGSGDVVVQTTALDTDQYLGELAEAMHHAVIQAKDDGLTALQIMKVAMPIAYKLSGYKADSVTEQRTLVCGYVSPENCDVLTTAGR
jgi:hypothetical protein